MYIDGIAGRNWGVAHGLSVLPDESDCPRAEDAVRARGDAGLPDAHRARFAVAAWAEIDAIEAALARHGCGIERSHLFQGRELLFK